MHHGEKSTKISAVAMLYTLWGKSFWWGRFGVTVCANSKNVILTDPIPTVGHFGHLWANTDH